MKKYLDTLSKIILQGGGAALGFITVLLLTKELSKNDFAIYSLITTGILLINSASSLGFLQYANVYVPNKSKKEKNWYYISVLYVFIINSFILSITYLYIYNLDISFGYLLFMLSTGLNFYTKSVMTTEGNVVKAIVYQNILVPLSIIISLSLSHIFGIFSLQNIFYISSALILSFNIITILNYIVLVDAKKLMMIFSFFKVSIVMMKTSLMQLSFRFADILIMPFLGFALGDIAIYVVASKLNILFVFAQNFILTRYTASFSTLCKNKQYKKVSKLYNKLRKILGIYTVLVILPCFVFSPMIVKLFGDGYGEAAIVVQILILGAIFNNIAGPAGLLLNINGMHRYNFQITVLSFILLIILIIVLGVNYGIIGVAIGNSIAVATRNSLAYLKISGFLKNV